MVSYTTQFKHKTNQKASTDYMQKGAGCCSSHVTSLVASCDSTVK